ncbi:hypothetical protein QWY86_19145 [Pedobacter aquatilis]|uniref:tetratricopeptide repeat protein n=1 Tax=Pedobacter aquatilis TaxID=351343 RepID=UPI0025B41144|nr:hypothetical protein [Pedobacter aquatilis]MDN3588806.1 hypothetical protein [Pedobacter aquatilis]
MATRKQINEHKLFKEAKALESTKDLNDLPRVASFYEKLIKLNPLHIDANNRLMVVYRKLGESTKEVKIIKSAIKSYQDNIDKDRNEWIKENKAKAAASSKLAETMGLIDIKGKPVYENEILSGWKNRLMLLQSRISKSKATKAKLEGKKKAKKARKMIVTVASKHQRT